MSLRRLWGGTGSFAVSLPWHRGALHSPALAAAAQGRPRFPRRALSPAPPPARPWCGPRLGPALPRAASGPAQRPARGEKRSRTGAFCPPLLPWQRLRRRAGLGPVGADSGRTRAGRGGLGPVGAYRPQAEPGRAPLAPEQGAAGSEEGLGGRAGRADGRAGGCAGVDHEGVRRCVPHRGSGGQSWVPRTTGSGWCPEWAPGAAPALPRPHTPHVNSPWAAPPAPRGLSAVKPTAAFVSPALCLVSDTNRGGVTV